MSGRDKVGENYHYRVAEGAATGALLVAPSDALKSIKASAWRRCSGADDQVDIQAAFAALPPFTGTLSAPVGGGRCLLGSGRFYNSGAIDIPDPHMTLQGQGPSTMIYAQAGMTDHVIKTSRASPVYGIQIRDLFIQGVGAADGDYCGVNVEGMFDPLLENLWIMQTKGAGIFGNGATKLFELAKVLNCRLHNCGQYAGATYRQGVALLNGGLNRLINNTALQNGTDGFLLLAAHSSLLVGNQTDTNEGNGYSFVGVKNLQMVGPNWSYNDNASSGNAAIEVYPPFGQGKIIGNFVLGAQRTGIRLGTLEGGAADIDDLVCTGNVISDTDPLDVGYYALLIDGAGTIENSIIAHNSLANNDLKLSVTVSNRVNTRIQDNPGYVTENSGPSTGTGAQQTIAHGLAATPNRVLLSNEDDGANPYQSAAADATNIYITAVDTKKYQWKAEVV